MNEKQLFIPDRINVGFQNREGTYTKKLAYVIYFDQKGVLRKEKSWQGWRDHKIASVIHTNEPTEGFVLNKGVGGGRASYGWNARNEYIRVYDPRDFEFEISVANLLFILRECDCSKGKGLEGKFVYAWDGTELVLLPAISSDYQNSKKYTDLQSQGVHAKDLIAGATYTTKKQEQLIFLGKFDYHYLTSSYRVEVNKNKKEKKWVFWDSRTDKYSHPNDGCFVFLNDLKSIAVLHSDTVVSNYAELVDKYAKSKYGSKIVKLFTAGRAGTSDYWTVEQPDGSFVEWSTRFDYQKKTEIEYCATVCKVTLKDGVLNIARLNEMAYPPGKSKPRWGYGGGYKSIDWVSPTNQRLFALLESGAKFRLSNGSFVEPKVKPNPDNFDDEGDFD